MKTTIIANPLFPLILLAFLVSFAPSHKAALEETVLKANERLENLTHAHFSAMHRQKYFTDTDTTDTKMEVWWKLVPKDTLLGWYTLIKSADSTDLYYNGLVALYVDHRHKTVSKYDISNWNDPIIDGSTLASAVMREWTRGIPTPEAAQKDGINMKLLGEGALKIMMEYPDEEETSNESRLITLDESYLPVHLIFLVDFMEMHQYVELSIDMHSEESEMIDSTITNYSYPEQYDVTVRLPEEYEEPELLPHGEPAPDFRLGSFDGDTIELSQLQGRVVLLDFWYMSCYPCIMAMPHLQVLHEQYGDRGFTVLGINYFDRKRSKEQLDKFLNHRNITFPSVYSERSVDSMYQVQGYPTTYILDQEGKVAYSQIGFSEELVGQMDSIIQVLLSEPTMNQND